VAGLLHPETIRHLPEVTNWLHHAARARKRVAESGGLDAPDAMERAVAANVVVQLEKSADAPCVTTALDEGHIALPRLGFTISSQAPSWLTRIENKRSRRLANDKRFGRRCASPRTILCSYEH